MKEIPRLFNGDMVRAILGGDKTQTRRPAKFEPNTHDVLLKKSPFGKAGDILWVRENLSVVDMPDMGAEPSYESRGYGLSRFRILTIGRAAKKE